MIVYALMLTSDPYEPRETHSAYISKEIAEKAMNKYLDIKTKGSQKYREYLTKDDEQFGPHIFIDEITVLEDIDPRITEGMNE